MPATSWTISLEGKAIGSLINDHCCFQNKESTEKASIWKIRKYDQKKYKKNETSQKVKRTENCEKSYM